MGSGSPATLATVTDKMGPGGPLLRPYPDWSWHNNSCICDGIANVHRVHVSISVSRPSSYHTLQHLCIVQMANTPLRITHTYMHTR